MSLHFFPDPLDGLDTWTPIATRDRVKRGKWKAVPDAPFGLREARQLREQGKLLQALKRDGETETVVVRRRTADTAR